MRYIISGGLTSEGRGQEGQSQRDLKICTAADACLGDGGGDPEPANACDAVSRSSPEPTEAGAGLELYQHDYRACRQTNLQASRA